MQNKSAIWVFTILLTLACLYQLSFTLVTSSVEGDAHERASAQVDSVLDASSDETLNRETLLREYETNYLTEIANVSVYPLFGHTYKYCKKREINLGLDLQGGMNVTLEVTVTELISSLAGAKGSEEEFKSVIKRARELQLERTENFVILFGEAYEEIKPGVRLSAIFSNFENKDKIFRDDTNEQVLAKIQEEADEAVKRTEQVLRRRIDNLGVVQPKIQRLVSSGRIIVELPGVKDPARVRKILQGTAKLEFWETYSNRDTGPYFSQINQFLASRAKAGEKTETVEPDSTVTVDVDTNQIVAITDPDSTEKEEGTDLSKLLSEGAGSEGDSLGNANAGPVSEADRKKENPLFAIFNVPTTQVNGQLDYARGPVVGNVLLSDTSEVKKILAMQEVRDILPRDIKLLWAAKPDQREYRDADGGTAVQEVLDLFAIKITSSEGRAELEGDAVTNTRVQADPLGNPEVVLYMNPSGAERWRIITGNNVNKSVAIVLDDLVYSAPNVSTEISGGVSSISGNFTTEEADDLGNVLKAGKLPAPAKIIEEAIVGPTLGAEAVQNGLTSFLFALFLVLIYMYFYYNRAGIIADVALLANLFFVLGVLSSLGATLTLPGIAGIVLTIGMSVDANVLIYERIREELTAGKGLRLAIVDGYKNAYSSIIDANLTTLLTGVVLYVFGSGPIKGFATTLIIGILTSLFSAIFITRMLFEWQLEKNAKISFSTKLTEGAFKKLAIAFVSKRKLFYIGSGILILIGIGSLFTNSLDFGVDFTGGRTYTVRFDNSAKESLIADALEEQFVNKDGTTDRPEVKTYGESNQVKITTNYLIENSDTETDAIVEGKLNAGLLNYDASAVTLASIKVEPTIADDVRESAGWAIFISLIGIFFYIWVRFRKWQFGLGALAALAHDVLILLGLFSLLWKFMDFSLEVDQAFIAAVLTVVGYSINDTVVVFDRIREYLGLYKRKDYKEVVNDALNSTLSRTINTSLSTFMVLLIIFLFGGEVIRGFVFALMIGVAVGTYSSLCVATPVMLDLDRKKENLNLKK